MTRPSPLPPLRLLIVEDVEDDATLLVSELARSYAVTECRVDTAAALAAALDAEPWDMVITDYSMPQFSALNVLDALRVRDLDLPCIVISGTIDEDSASEALRAGARDFISKSRLTRLAPAVGRELREKEERRRKRLAEQQLAEARKALDEQFRHAQRMDSIGSLAGGIAHDFNNLLTAILGFSSLLLEEPAIIAAPPQVRADVDQIRQAGHRAAALTNQLLAFSRKQILQPAVLNINPIITNLEPMLLRLIRADIVLTTRVAGDLGSAFADVGQIEQVIMNLVVNARDAMPGGGRITIETANVDLDAAYAARTVGVNPGPYVMLAVSDTGAGMTPEVQARIFEPFFTTKPAGHGTGLGLATIFGIVKQHDGHIRVYSEPGHGTTFKIYFPRVEDAAEKRPAPHAAMARSRGETVLLVDDERAVRELAREVLKVAGYRVLEAADGAEATAVAAAHEGPIDLLVTDVVMPGISGRALAHRLATPRPAMKVLFMSGYTDGAVLHHGMLAAGVAFLQKPFTPAIFTDAVRQALDTGENHA